MTTIKEIPLASISEHYHSLDKTQAALEVDAIQSIVDQYFEEVLKNKSYSGRTSRGATWARANDQLNAIHNALIEAAELKAQNNELLDALKEMVAMMDSGDEHGAGSPWHMKAEQAIARAEKERGVNGN